VVLGDLDAQAARDRLERLKVAAADRAQNGVVGKAGEVGNLARGESVARAAAAEQRRRRCQLRGDRVWTGIKRIRVMILRPAVYRQVSL
jgi:hypothetical protein